MPLKVGAKNFSLQIGSKWYHSIRLDELNRLVPFLAHLVRVDFWTQLSVAFVCVRTRKNFFSPNRLKMVPFDSSRRAESIGTIFRPFGEGRFLSITKWPKNYTIFSLFGEKKFFRVL